jgi:hypothetical protein
VFFNSGLSMTRRVSDFIQTGVGFVAAFKLRPTANVTPALKVKGVRELQQPVLILRQRPKISRRWALETLSGFECR